MRSKREIGWLKSLDGIRGCSIIMVLSAHVFKEDWPEFGGRFGVTVFFVLSGFLITRLLINEYEINGCIALKSFFIRRAFRLFPLYFLVLLTYCCLIYGTNLREEARANFTAALPWFLLYFQEIPYFYGHAGQLPFFQSWSLGIEEKFYFVWPFIGFVCVQSLRARALIAAGGFVLFSAMRTFEAGRGLFPYAAILFGCLLALVYRSNDLKLRISGWFNSQLAYAAIAVWFFIHALASGNFGWWSVAAELTYPIAVGGVLLSGIENRSIERMLSIRPLELLGKWSYGIYLVHLLARQAVERGLKAFGLSADSGLIVFSLMLILSAALAAALQGFFENPIRVYGRSVARRFEGAIVK